MFSLSSPGMRDLVQHLARHHRGLALLHLAGVECAAVTLGVDARTVAEARDALENPRDAPSHRRRPPGAPRDQLGPGAAPASPVRPPAPRTARELVRARPNTSTGSVLERGHLESVAIVFHVIRLVLRPAPSSGATRRGGRGVPEDKSLPRVVSKRTTVDEGGSMEVGIVGTVLTSRATGSRSRRSPRFGERTPFLQEGADAARESVRLRIRTRSRCRGGGAHAVRRPVSTCQDRAIYVGSESHPYAVKPSARWSPRLSVRRRDPLRRLEFACKAGSEGMFVALSLVKAGQMPYALAIGADTSQAPG